MPDFFVPSKDLYIEVKGKLDSKARSKMRDVKKAHPGLDIRILFLSNNKITPNKPERYSDWADKFGYKYAIKHIPIDWVK